MEVIDINRAYPVKGLLIMVGMKEVKNKTPSNLAYDNLRNSILDNFGKVFSLKYL